MITIEAHGAKIPAVGLGTWELRGRACARVVEQALRLGYRHIDTAAIYENEREVGEALRASRVKRSEAFITTKVWQTQLAPRELERSAKESLARLRLSEVDLLLIHWPNPQIPLSESIGALCKMQRDGYARHIGVSNFTVAMLQEAVRLATEPLVAHQFEWHPYLDQRKVVAETRRLGLVPTAYSPIARGRAAGDQVLKTIGLAHEKTAGQVCLRYLIQEGAAVIPRTSKIERLTENISIFDFELTPAEMDQIRQLARPSGRIVDWAGSPQWDE
ncbi:MAG TPA: aldo/keto reductase [Xanthobacteraceae bacterium]|nr:aldo/keto reductase [Xanthobacteraceae bacterium]